MDTIKICRACHSDNLELFLPMGLHPPANQFLKLEQLDRDELSFPLNTCVCLDCALIQVADQIPADFFRNYVYVPSASETLRQHFAKFAQTLTDKFLLSPNSLVVDIGSNDGLFLKSCLDLQVKTLGIEPATNLTEIACSKGLEIINEYFSPEIARSVVAKYGTATVIVTTNTFNHIDDLHSFMQGVTILLDRSGVLAIEVPHALDLIEKNEFDTVYHEHLSEFSVKSLVDLFRFFEMEIFDIDRLEIHGGSMRVYAQKQSGIYPISPSVADWLSKEQAANLFDRSTYQAFSQRVAKNRQQLLDLLRDLKKQGKKLAGYGAPAKGNTLLNYYQIGTDLLEFLADKNSLKQGLYSPGMHIPVVPVEQILAEQPDYLLILAWNFADEIIRQQQEYRNRGGKFILPIPAPQIID